MILNYNNTLAKLKTILEEKQLNTFKWQAELDRIAKNASQKSLLLGQIQLVANNLFQTVNGHLNNRIGTASGTVQQLEKVGQFICDLSQIVSQYSQNKGL